MKPRLSLATGALSAVGMLLLQLIAHAQPSGIMLPKEQNFTLSPWARQPMLKNPVALAFDPHGRLYVVETSRRGTVDIDIRAHKTWVLEDLANQNLDHLRQMFRAKMAPGLSEENKTWLRDYNADGIHDWRDLTTFQEKVHVLQDTDGDGRADWNRVFAEGFNEEVNGVIAGVLPRGNEVFMTIYPDLWRLSDSDQDGIAEAREIMFRGFGVHAAFDGHDLHGLTVGPDGRLYFSVGDNGFSIRTQEGRRLHYPNTGAVLRCDWNGANLEVFAHGLRNTQELAFDEFGNLFSVDNDGDIRGERERFVYITEGSDSGWRLNWQFRKGNWGLYTQAPDYNPWIADGMWKPHFEGQPAYITPPLSNYSVGPGGFKYNPGTCLNDDYRGHFFLAQFPVKKITAFQARPKGAYFEMTNEHVLVYGMMASAMNFGPDGAMYIADWDGMWQPNEKGAIWKLDDPAQRDSAMRAEVQLLLAKDLENETPKNLATLLGHVDQRVRLKVQFELADRRQWRLLYKVAIDDKAARVARAHALWGIAQLRGNLPPRLGDKLPWNDVDPEIRAQSAKAAGELRATTAFSHLVKLLSDESPRAQFHAAISLGKLGKAEAVPHLFRLLEENADQDAYIRHAGFMGLAGSARVEQLLAAVDHSSDSVRVASVVALRRKKDSGVARFLSDSNPWIVREAARAIHDDFSIPGALPALARLLPDTRGDDEALVLRAISANLRLGDNDSCDRLMRYVLDPRFPVTMRIEALQSLADWNRSPLMDRVVGRVRPLSTRDAALPSRLLETHMEELFIDDSPALLSAAIQAAEKLNVKLNNTALLAIVNSGAQSSDSRLQALANLTEQGGEELEQLFVDLQQDNDLLLREKAFEIFGQSHPQMTSLFAIKNWNNLDLRRQQAGYRLFAQAKIPETDQRLEADMELLLQGKNPSETAFDIVEAAKTRATPRLKVLLEQRRKGLDKTDPLAGLRLALHGGDPDKGKAIYQGHVAAQCVRCHDAGGQDNQVGPPLVGIGKRVNREYLLRSLVDPNADIAIGYELATVETLSGDVMAGRLHSPDDSEVTLVLPDGNHRVIPREQIKKLTTTKISTMPPMSGILNLHEIRDLITHLGRL